MVQALIAGGADVNVTNRNGNTPLHMAVSKGNFNIFELLLYFYQNQTFFQFPGYIRGVADLLVKAKADLNIENNNGETPLKLAKALGSFSRTDTN